MLRARARLILGRVKIINDLYQFIFCRCCVGAKEAVLIDSRTFRTFFLSGNRSTDQSKSWLCSKCNTHSGGTHGDIYMHSEAPRCEHLV